MFACSTPLFKYAIRAICGRIRREVSVRLHICAAYESG